MRIETFDVIVSRNLTWTLPNAAGAYKEWSRVLKKGGRIINVDANYGADDFADTTGLPTNHAHFKVGDEMMRECEEIKRQLPISSYVRPAWDLETLGKLGFGKFSIDLGVSGRIYMKKDEFYNPTPLFIVCAGEVRIALPESALLLYGVKNNVCCMNDFSVYSNANSV